MSAGTRWDAVADVAEDFSSLLGPATEKLLELGKLFPGATVLDIACGTGALTRAAMQLVGESGWAVAIDSSPSMIARATELTGDLPNVRYYAHDAHVLNFKEQSADVIYSQFGFGHFDDPAQVARRAYALLKPGGRLALMALAGVEQNSFFTAAGAEIAPYLEGPLGLGGRGVLEALLRGAGFHQVKVRPIQALVNVADPDEYWRALRSALGIPASAPPAAVAGLRGANLSLALQFALAQVPTDEAALAVPSLLPFERVCARARTKVRELSPYELQKNLHKETVCYLDVREPEEWAQGVVKGALRIPRGELEERLLAELRPDAESIVTYCQNGDIGALAAARLVEWGFSEVWNLAGGFEAWVQEKLPIAKPPFA